VEEEERIVFRKGGKPVKDWNFKHVFDESASTADVYANFVKPIVAGVANGIAGTAVTCKA